MSNGSGNRTEDTGVIGDSGDKYAEHGKSESKTKTKYDSNKRSRVFQWISAFLLCMTNSDEEKCIRVSER